MDTIKNVVFDLGGVLVGLDIERCRRAYRRIGMDAVAELLQPYYPVELFGLLEKGEIDPHEACERMRRISSAPCVTDEQIAQAYGEFLTDVPFEKLRMIDRLRARGLHTYVLSNNNPFAMDVIHRMFATDGKRMEDYFDKIYLSYEMRLLKPSPEIFRAMIADSGMEPEQTLFIDDGPKNIETARSLGFAVYMPAEGEDFSHLFDNLP